MLEMGILFGYIVIGLISGRWLWSRKAKEYYQKHVYKPKQCYALGRYWRYHDVSCQCKYEKDAQRSRDKASGWAVFGMLWPLIPVVLFFSAPMEFEKEIEAQKKDAEDLKKMKELAKANGLEWPA